MRGGSRQSWAKLAACVTKTVCSVCLIEEDDCRGKGAGVHEDRVDLSLRRKGKGQGAMTG